MDSNGKRIAKAAVVILALIVSARAADATLVEITTCGTVINTPGEYGVSSSLTSNSDTVDCIDVDAPGVSIGIAPNISLTGPGGSAVTAAGIKIRKGADGIQLISSADTIQRFGIGIDDEGSGVVVSADSSGLTIMGNAAQRILVSGASDVLIDSVNSEQNGAAGLELLRASGVTVKGTSILQLNGGYGLWVRSSSNNQFFNLDTFDNKLSGIYVGESDDDQLNPTQRDGLPSRKNAFVGLAAIQNSGAGFVMGFGDSPNVITSCTGQLNVDKDAVDETPGCGQNEWIGNSFTTTNRKLHSLSAISSLSDSGTTRLCRFL
jgi:hypothetical protein